MRKEVYTRKPKKPFKKLRAYLNTELGKNKTKIANDEQEFTRAQIEKAKENIRKNIKRTKIKEGILFGLLLTIIIFIFIYFSK